MLKPNPFPTLAANSPFGCDSNPSAPNTNRVMPGAAGIVCAFAANAQAKIKAVLSTDTAFDCILSPLVLTAVGEARYSVASPTLRHFTRAGYREFQSTALPVCIHRKHSHGRKPSSFC